MGDRATVARLTQDRRAATGWAVALGVSGGVTMLASLGALNNPALGPGESGVAFAVPFLLGTSLLTTGIVVPLVVHADQQFVYRAYSTTDADAKIEAYNQRLREELGLSETDVQGIDLQTRAPPSVPPWFAGNAAGVTGTF